MFDDDRPHEPDEFDPEERWGSPEEDLPNVPTAPSPDVDESDVDPELMGLWWRSVALANVALGGVAVGLMVIGFRGMWMPGLAGVGLGLLAGFRLYQHYRTFEERDDLGTVADAADGPGDTEVDDGSGDTGATGQVDDPAGTEGTADPDPSPGRND